MINVIVTDAAVSEIEKIRLDGSLNANVRLRIRCVGGGCSGMNTKLDLDEVFDETKDEIFEVNNTKITIDKRSALYLDGAIIDFHDGLDKRGFIVHNPNLVKSCKCGSTEN